MSTTGRSRISLSDIGSEPFRILFPAAVLAGIVGVVIWPLHFAGLVSLYPGQAHARIMASGLLGGFLLGFLGTAMPRMLSAPVLGVRNVLVLLGMHLLMVILYATGKIGWGDHLFLAWLIYFLVLLIMRFRARADIPPPGFSLVGLALLCALAGAFIGVLEHHDPELDPYLVMLRRLLIYQGFILLPVLGVGPFLLPRFFGLDSLHNFPEMRSPSRDWMKRASLAFAIGLVIVGSLFLEASGWYRLAHLLRFAATLFYLAVEFPFRRARSIGGALGASLWIAFAVLLSGFLLIAFFPA
jgi:uncharacterized protein involved in response to NO